jgi:cob(I)alamin adenosyltransferase
MGHRLTRIYTKTGDDGTTGLADGSRVSKSDLRIEALGAVDELNCALGRVLAAEVPGEVRRCLDRVQHDLFEVGAELSLPGQVRVKEENVARLETELDGFNESLPPLKEFILPGGTAAAADAHFARAVCRRVERTLVALGKQEKAGEDSRRYVNRLSDLLFVLTRVLNRAGGRDDVYWRPAKPGA